MERPDLFAWFAEECYRLAKEWGLLTWDLSVTYKSLDEDSADAKTDVDRDSRSAEVSLDSAWAGTIEEARKLARHEMIHLLLADLTLAKGKARELEEEKLVHLLLRLLF